MRVVWISGLPNDVRLHGAGRMISPVKTAAWSWILGHLPPPPRIELHILCPVLGLEAACVEFDYLGAHWHCFRQSNYELMFMWRRMYYKMRGSVRRIRPDIVHGWGGETGCGFLATMLSKRAIVGIQGLLRLYDEIVPGFDTVPKSFLRKIQYFLNRGLERLSYKRAAVCFAESNLAKAGLAKYYGLNNCVVIYHPLRREFFDPIDLAARKKAPGPIFIFVGSLCQRKGALDALNAFIEAGISNGQLVFIGSGSSRDALQKKIAECHLERQVIFYENCSADQVVKLLDKGHFFLLPTYGDTGPTALKEALARALYPIGYDNSGPGEIVRAFGAGRLVRTGSVSDLALAIRSAAEERELCLALACAASGKVRSALSADAAWDCLTKNYEKIMAGENL